MCMPILFNIVKAFFYFSNSLLWRYQVEEDCIYRYIESVSNGRPCIIEIPNPTRIFYMMWCAESEFSKLKSCNIYNSLIIVIKNERLRF